MAFLGRAKAHHPDLILPEIHLEGPQINLSEDLSFQRRRNLE